MNRQQFEGIGCHAAVTCTPRYSLKVNIYVRVISAVLQMRYQLFRVVTQHLVVLTDFSG